MYATCTSFMSTKPLGGWPWKVGGTPPVGGLIAGTGGDQRNGEHGSQLRRLRISFHLISLQYSGYSADHGNTVFQSFFMLITVQPRCFASSISDWLNVPTLVSGRPLAGP